MVRFIAHPFLSESGLRVVFDCIAPLPKKHTLYKSLLFTFVFVYRSFIVYKSLLHLNCLQGRGGVTGCGGALSERYEAKTAG